MKNKKISLIALIFGVMLLIPTVSAVLKNEKNEAEIDMQPIDLGSKIRSADYELQICDEDCDGIPDQDQDKDMLQLREWLGKGPEYYDIGDIINWVILDDFQGKYYWAAFELKAIGRVSEIWVQVNLSYPANDPREYPIVTDDQIEYLLNEFEGNIYPTDVAYFGEPDLLKGMDSTLSKDYIDQRGRNVILVSNVRDEAYYDPTYPYYIAGFFSTTFENFFDRNIITIDSHNWEDRIGPDAKRPYLYEAIIAHEYQHLIHSDYNPGDDSFMNEGCSMYAEPLCGYPLAWGDIDSFLATPDNSLTKWGDHGGINILADYGQALLWTVYLSDHYGGAALISHFVKSGIPGIAGINAALEYFGYDVEFNEVYYDWTLANLIPDYTFMDLSDTNPPRIYDITSADVFPILGTDFGETITILNNPTGVFKLGGYGTDYIKIKDYTSGTFIFDGDDFAVGPTWEYTPEGYWYSTPAGSEQDLGLITQLDLTELSAAKLSFDTFYLIEELWDFGFVQVSLDNGITWISLENEYTTTEYDPGAYPAIIDQLPGLTGDLTEWINMEFDLTPYVGNEILIGFRYMTDWATEEEGWYIDNVKLNDFMIDDELFFFNFPEVDFMVNFVIMEDFDGIPTVIDVFEMDLDNTSESGSINLENIMTENQYFILVVSPNLGPVDYCLDMESGVIIPM